MFEALDKARRWCAVYQAVVKGETEEHHLANFQALGPGVDHHLLGRDAADSEDSALGQVDNRSECINFVHTQVGESESASL